MPKNPIVLSGTLVSGRGRAHKDIRDNTEEIRRLTSEDVAPGSLNVILERPIFLSNAHALRFAQDQRLLWPGTINSMPVWLYRWQQAPLHVIEVLSQARLRERLGLCDDDRVEIEIDEIYVEDVPKLGHVLWGALWWRRLDWPYKRNRYYSWTKPWAVLLGATQQGGGKVTVKSIARRVYRKAKDFPVIGPAARRLRDFAAPHVGCGSRAAPYVFVREQVPASASANEQEFARLRNVLNYTKTSGSAYSATQYPAGYHTVEIGGRRLVGQRDPQQRLRGLPLDLSGKRVLDLGTNQGGMLLAVRDRIALGVGLDYDPRMINAANRMAGSAAASNLHFFVFDLENDPLELIPDLIPGGRVDVVFLLSVCMWIRNWRGVIRFCATHADAMIFESNGSDAQQTDQEVELRRNYAFVHVIADCSEDDAQQKRRKLLVCEQPYRETAELHEQGLPATS